MCLSGLVQASPSTRHCHYLNTTQLGGLLSTDVFNCVSDAKTSTPRPVDCGVGLPWVKSSRRTGNNVCVCFHKYALIGPLMSNTTHRAESPTGDVAPLKCSATARKVPKKSTRSSCVFRARLIPYLPRC